MLPWSQVTSLPTYIRLFLTILESPVLHVFNVPTSFCFFLFLFSTTYLLLLIPPLPHSLSVWGPQEWSQEFYVLLMNMDPDRDHLRSAPTSVGLQGAGLVVISV